MNNGLKFVVLGFGSLISSTSVYAANCTPPAGQFASVQGTVEVVSDPSEPWRAAKSNDPLCQGDSIRVGAQSRAAVSLANGAVLRVDQNTTLRLVDVAVEPEKKSILDLIKGAFQSFSRKPRQLTINTPYLNGSIEGTEFVFRVDDTASKLVVFEGTVVASNEQGKIAVPGGSAVVAEKGQAPQNVTIVKPRSEVQWALYYPPVLALGESASGDAASDLQKAAQLLSVGRVDEARPMIDSAIAADPNSAKALALRAVIEVVQNQTAEALADAEKATSIDPSSSSRIALSYALQATYKIDAARDNLAAAVGKDPNDALAWARLAELELMLGNRSESIAAARKSESLAPNLERSQMVLGFAELASFHNAEALAAFDRATQLDSADPLARLGRGLAQISQGKLHEGRHEIEIAVGLDGNSALLRAYLGKSYFEERRSGLDGQQFEIAKGLDPNDPTAYLYDGIRKQTENRPVEALADIQKSIALNDNRAVYRSRLLLDKDRASRGTSVARAYNDLGFTDEAIVEASNSLATDPSNAGAHRFLADAYQGERRREIARVSELLQAQMLQDLNLSPIQLSASEANLNIVSAGGPASAGFNEFTPMFQRNEAQAIVSALGGNNSTQGSEIAVSGLYDNVSVGLSALNYDTDGWRPNNGLNQKLYNFFEQIAISDKSNMQVEFRRRESTEGDLSFNFDPEDYQPNKTIDRNQDIVRFGYRYLVSPRSTILFSFIQTHRTELVVQKQELPPFIGDVTVTNSGDTDDQQSQGELQLISVADSANLVSGLSWSRTIRKRISSTSFDDSIIGNFIFDQEQTSYTYRDPRLYVYATGRTTQRLTWTLGGAVERYEEGNLEEKAFSPKLGLQLDIAPWIRLRSAAFRTVKPVLANNRTLEPSQIAGFNQLSDDRNGTKSKRLALAFDLKSQQSVQGGIEFTRRDYDEPFQDAMDAWKTDERTELFHRLHIEWAPLPQLSVHAAYVYDVYRADNGPEMEVTNPGRVKTRSVPLTLNAFLPMGLFASVGATHVNQDVTYAGTAIHTSGDDEFNVVDASFGYRLPKRTGTISVAAKNLFDKDFKYQDDSYREFRDEPSTGPYFPKRMVMARAVVNF